MDYLFFILICFIWSSSFILMKKASLMFGPISLAGITASGGALVIWLFWKFKRMKWDLKRKHIPILFILIPCASIYPFAIQPFLISRAGHGFIGMMVSLVPIFTMLISIPILNKYPAKLQLLGVAGGLIGVMIIMSDGFHRNIPIAYLLLAVTVPFTYAFGNTIISRFFDDVSSVTLSLVIFTVCGLTLLPTGLVLESVNMEADLATTIFALFTLAILARGLASMMFLRIIKARGPLFAGMTTYIIPLGALGWSWMDKETITLKQLSAMGIILLMVWLVQSNSSKHKSGEKHKILALNESYLFVRNKIKVLKGRYRRL